MAFYTWIDSPVAGTNVQAEATFGSDSQRTSGFQSGTAASAIRVNTALRQSTLVTEALMSAMNLTSLSYLDSVGDVTQAISNFFDDLNVVANPTLGGTESSLTGITIHGTKYKIASGGTTVSANPTLGGSETDLTGLQIGSTKYANHKVVPKIISMSGSISDTADVITLDDYITNYDYIDLTLEYMNGVNQYQLASVGFSPLNTVYDQRVAIPAYSASTMSCLTVSFLSNTMTCVSNPAGVTWLPVKCIGYKFS